MGSDRGEFGHRNLGGGYGYPSFSCAGLQKRKTSMTGMQLCLHERQLRLHINVGANAPVVSHRPNHARTGRGANFLAQPTLVCGILAHRVTWRCLGSDSSIPSKWRQR